MKRVAFLVNGSESGAMGIRGRALAKELGSVFEIGIFYRLNDKAYAIGAFYQALRDFRPSVCYVLDMAFSGVLAAAVRKLLCGCAVVIDTGDAIFELAKSASLRGPVGLAATLLLERSSIRLADRLVVRSHYHAEVLAVQGREAAVVPDGVHVDAFASAAPSADDRRKHGLNGAVTVGFVGSVIWNQRWNMCYGWDLIESLRILKNESVMGVVIGDGDGIAHLQRMIAAYGLEGRVVFLGRVDYDRLPQALQLIDVCLSTQTNDPPGRVRTSGKLPLYLAARRFVLATNVGEASRVLPSKMLLDYDGTKDERYPARLADRVRELVRGGNIDGSEGIEIARRHFSYPLLAERVRAVLLAA